MNNLLVVVPSLDRSLTENCISSILKEKNASGFNKEDILLVDNTQEGTKYDLLYDIKTYRDPQGHNIGVPRAWNIGAREVLKNPELEYLVIMSQSMLFGPELHTTFVKQMRTFWGANVIECDGHSWHLVAIHRSVFERVGLFDENFYPGYFEQIDFCYRLRMLGLEGAWPRVWCNALSQSVGKYTKDEHVNMILATPLLDYYKEKWGGAKGSETFILPWGDKPLSYFPDNDIPFLANKYGLTQWW